MADETGHALRRKAEPKAVEQVGADGSPREARSTQAGDLAARLASGDERAAEDVFARYVARLTSLARSRLSAKLAARVDADDVVMSAYRSFFVRARGGQFSLASDDDLWRLLAEITLHKLYRQVARHSAARRSIDREVPVAELSHASWLAVSREPTPDAAAALADEVEHLMRRLPPLARRVLELRLQGEALDAIARLVGRSDRTVRRQLHLARELLDDGKGDLGEIGPDRTSRRATPAGRPTRRGERRRAARRYTAQPTGTRRPTGSDLLAPLAFGDYLLQRQIGAGAVGKVYRAAEKTTGRAVAVKFLRKSFVRDERIVARFRAEAETVARLSHPGIVAVSGLGRTPDGGYFIVMDLVNGVDLARRIAHGPASPRDAARWIADAATALDYSHRQGVVHCDLKPSNLLLAGGRVLVTDFGFARNLARTDVIADYVAGTPAYMAPEQIDAAWGPITPRTDVYGVGAVLFHLLTGRPPYVGDCLADVLSQIVSGGPAPSPARFRPDLPAPLVEACARCLAKTPADRFRDAAEVADVLRNTEWK